MTVKSNLLLIFPVLLACGPDETVSGFVDPDARYVLTALSSAEASGELPLPRATIQFPQEGEVIGEAPCNRYAAQQKVPYPWFELGPIVATRRTCPDQASETLYLRMLSEMTFAEVSGEVLLLSNDQDETLEFTRQSD